MLKLLTSLLDIGTENWMKCDTGQHGKVLLQYMVKYGKVLLKFTVKYGKVLLQCMVKYENVLLKYTEK